MILGSTGNICDYCGTGKTKEINVSNGKIIIYNDDSTKTYKMTLIDRSGKQLSGTFISNVFEMLITSSVVES